MPLLGETDSPRLVKYWPEGTIPFPSQGLDAELNGDHTVGIGIAPNMIVYGDDVPSVHIVEIQLEFVLPTETRLLLRYATVVGRLIGIVSCLSYQAPVNDLLRRMTDCPLDASTYKSSFEPSSVIVG